MWERLRLLDGPFHRWLWAMLFERWLASLTADSKRRGHPEDERTLV